MPRPPKIPPPPKNRRMPTIWESIGSIATEKEWTGDDQPQKGIIRRIAWFLIASAASGGVWAVMKWGWWFGMAG